MPQRLKILLAFAVIYLVWGSTFLAIRIGVHEVPPLLFAALRFFTAGLILLAYTLARREPLPTPRQWGSIAILATLIFLTDYGFLFWAEQRVPPASPPSCSLPSPPSPPSPRSSFYAPNALPPASPSRSLSASAESPSSSTPSPKLPWARTSTELEPPPSSSPPSPGPLPPSSPASSPSHGPR